MTAAAPYCFEDATGWRVWMNSQWSDDTTLMVQCQYESTTTSEEIFCQFLLISFHSEDFSTETYFKSFHK